MEINALQVWHALRLLNDGNGLAVNYVGEVVIEEFDLLFHGTSFGLG